MRCSKEFRTNKFIKCYGKKGIATQLTAPHSSYQNGIVKKMNRKLRKGLVFCYMQMGFSDNTGNMHFNIQYFT